MIFPLRADPTHQQKVIARYSRLEALLEQEAKVMNGVMNQAAEILGEWRMYEAVFHGGGK